MDVPSGRLTRALASVALVALLACGEAGGSADDPRGDSGSNPDGSGGASSGAGGSSGTAPAPGPAAAGWVSAFADKGAKCSGEEDSMAALAHVTVGTTTLYVGFEQVGGNNQDPFVARFDAGKKVYCRYSETQGPDGRALGITWNGGPFAYVVYTIVGGGSDLEGKGGWLGSYAPNGISGGGPKVSYVGQVNVADGALSSGSFVIAVTSANKVNGMSPKGAVTVLPDGTVEFLGSSAHKPIDASGKKSMTCTDYPFDVRYRLSPDLRTLVCADASNCVAERPCP